MKSILIVARGRAVFPEIRRCLGDRCETYKAQSVEAALHVFRQKRQDFLFIDMALLKEAEGNGDGCRSVMQSFRFINPDVEIIVMTTQEMIRDTVMAVKSGASNYLTYPINPEEVKLVAERIYDSAVIQSELHYLRNQASDVEVLDIIKTRSPIMKNVFEKVRSVAPTKSTVLIVGETGTGKGLLAQLIHKESLRGTEQFINIHCGAIPDTLIESELFGHEKGAFTGATARKLGKFDIAKGGTIFLDEISTITPSAQIKLLQILQEGIFQRVGGEKTIKADVRIIAATNVDLWELCEKGQFRKDLYYRLNVFPIEVPPLRERKEDIPLLIDAFLDRLNKLYSKGIDGLLPSVLRSFDNYDWPGNIRELQNLVERAYIIEKSSMITPASFSNELFAMEVFNQMPEVDVCLPIADVRKAGVEAIERKYLDGLLAKCGGRIMDAARSAGITTRQLNKLMKKYGFQKANYKTRLH